jgi:endonuclease YncB( thermonuclease family)
MGARRYFSMSTDGKQGLLARRNGRALGIGAFLATLSLGVALLFGQSLLPADGRGDVAQAAESSRILQARVIDGDTLEDLSTGERIRLANIDTAEMRDGARCDAERAHGERARTALRSLLAGADQVSVRRTGREDSFGRTIGYVLIDGRDVGRALIAEGLARPWRGRREPWCGPGGRLLT